MRVASHTLTYSFALFAMFFGSGNLVFPLQIGQSSQFYWLYAFFGLFITGVALPFLGLFVIKLHHGKYLDFFSEAGKLTGIVLPLFTLSLLGSFGVIPRCITVAHGGINFIFPQLSLLPFSIIFCLITFVACFKENSIINSLGKYLSPILFLSLIVLILSGIFKANLYYNNSITYTEIIKNFNLGFFTGYQTMDLFAAFFFSSFMFKDMVNNFSKTHSYQQIVKFAIKPSLLAGFILGSIYLGLVFLGAHYSDLIKNISPELMLPTIAIHTMGPMATWFIAIAMLFSCLTTAIALNSIYTDYLVNLIKLKKSKFPYVLAFTTMVSFFVSLLDFRGIANFLAPLLEISYPGIIALTIMCLITTKHKTAKKVVFYSLCISMILASIQRLG